MKINYLSSHQKAPLPSNLVALAVLVIAAGIVFQYAGLREFSISVFGFQMSR